MLPHVRHMQCLLTMSRCHFSGGRSLTGGGTSLGLEHAVPGPQPCLSDPTAIMPMGRKQHCQSIPGPAALLGSSLALDLACLGLNSDSVSISCVGRGCG